jgi:hypothetical protein
MRRSTLILLFALATQLAIALPAFAGQCYEGIGCASTQYFPKNELKKLGCQPLWEVRNRIYKDKGYCFKTQTAIQQIGNAGCTITNMAAVPLNAIEHSNIAAIRKVEKAKSCSYGG